MTGHTCPVDGCDYGEQADKSMAAVRAHINASGDDGHNWQDLKDEVTAESDDQEPDREQTEATESSGSDTTDDSSDDGDRTSRTGSDYEEQIQAAADSGGDGQDTMGDRVDGDADDGGSGGVSTGALIAGTAGLCVAYLLATGDGDDDATPATDSEANSAASSTDSGGMSPSAIK